MKKKILIFCAIISFAIISFTGCTLSGLDLKVDNATTSKVIVTE